MFTGIVQGKASIKHIDTKENFKTFTISFPKGGLVNAAIGASIAINGTCMTVTSFDLEANTATFDAIKETLSITNIGLLGEGDLVNYERAAKFGDEIGGHSMSGHIFQTVAILGIEKTETNHIISFELPAAIKPYVLVKGYIGLNGCSLTIAEVNEDAFRVYLIPETLELTTFGALQAGAKINVEIDPQTQTIVDTVERILNQRRGS